jgi:prepilin-type N-terminal cleavage/methylation domain-containing protein
MKKIKPSFTLIEILISITIFSIVVLFLYRALDGTKKTNSFFSKQVVTEQDLNKVKSVFFLDLKKSLDNNSTITDSVYHHPIIRIKSSNYYHNPYYNNISYIITNTNKLLRIESKDQFPQNGVDYTFFDTAYIDILLENIKKIKVSNSDKKDDKRYLYVELHNGKKFFIII